MSWAIDMMWKATAILCAAFALHYALRRASAAVRDLVWTLAFAGLLALPVLSVATPDWQAPLAGRISVAARAASGAPAATANWALWLWMAGVAVLLGRLAVSHWRVALLARRAEPLASEFPWLSLRESPPGTMPLTWGVLRPVVLLPADAARWPEQLRRSVLTHEAAHVERGDGLKQLLTQIACSLYWFHPLAWLAGREASRARERACDDAVLNRGTKASDYASHLLDVARTVRPLESAAAMPYCAQLEGRLLAILDATISRRMLTRKAIATAGIVAGCLLLPFAGVRLLAEEVHKIGDGVTPPTLIYKVEPAYSEQPREAGIEGRVVLGVVVNADGAPENIKVLESLDASLDANAIDAIKQWRFKPGTKDGKPVAVGATIEVNFRLT